MVMPERALWFAMTALVIGGCEKPAEPARSEAVRRDAAEYARDQGVSQAEAERRLDLQGGVGAVGVMLGAAEPETFGGYWIEHQPSFGGVAAFTRDAQATLDKHLAGRTLPTSVRAVTVRHSLRELLQVQREVGGVLREAGVGIEGVGVEVVTNRVLVLVRDTTAARDQLKRAGRRLHPSVAFEQGWIETLEGDADLIPRPPMPPPPLR